MNQTLKKVKDLTADVCVTICLPTHRTKPDNQKDGVLLKQLIKEVEERISQELDKREVWAIMEKINEVVDEIDHNYNQEGLVIFANNDFSTFERLPIKIEARTVVDKTFATRDLVRAMHLESSYYILTLSRSEARMIEAHNDKVIKELSTPFPVENDSFYTTSSGEAANAQRQTNLVQEFFNRVDKLVNEVVKSHPLPVFIVSESSSYSEYLQVADNKEIFIGNANKNVDHKKPHHIVEMVWSDVQAIVKERIEKRKQELKTAVGTGKFKSDITDIWFSILNGKGQTLFVEKGFYQPAKWDGEKLEVLELSQAAVPGVVDDIIDEMIESNLRYGGDTVFLNKEELENFQGLALVTRY